MSEIDNTGSDRGKFVDLDQKLQDYYQREAHSFHSTLMTFSTAAWGVIFAFVPKTFPFATLDDCSRLFLILSLILFFLCAVSAVIVKGMDQSQAYRRVFWERARHYKENDSGYEKAFHRVDKLQIPTLIIEVVSFILGMLSILTFVIIQISVDP